MVGSFKGMCYTFMYVSSFVSSVSGVQAGIIVRSLHHEVCVVLNLFEPLIDTVRS